MENVLVIAPHADDEILGVGGTMAKLIDEGSNVYVCVVTSGENDMFPQITLDKLRKEVLSSHKYLGIKETFFLDLPAVRLSETPKHIVNKKIFDVINKVKPQKVFIPHFGDMHLDHYIVSQAAMVGVRPKYKKKILEVYAYETLSETEWNVPHAKNMFIPNVYYKIDDYLDKKLKAMKFFETQLENFPSPRSLEAIESLAKLRGSTINVNAAEAFSLIRRIVI